MVNFGLNSASILGIFLAVAGASLYFMRSVRPELARDHDIFFAAVGLLCGFILLFQGWRLDPILQFGQFLLTGSAIFFAVESIRLRAVATEQARRNTPIVDRDRPVSRTRVYTEAELDKIDPYDNYEGTPNYDSPRLRGYEDTQPRPSRRPSERRRNAPPTSDMRDSPRSNRSRSERSDYDNKPRPSRRRSSPTRSNGYDDWREQDEWNDAPTSPSRPRRSSQEERYPETSSRPVSKRRPNRPADLGRSYDADENYSSSLGQDYDVDLGRSYDDDDDVITTDYVDYQPLDNASDDYGDYGDEEQERERPSRRDWSAPTDKNNRDYDEEDDSQRKNPIDFDY